MRLIVGLLIAILFVVLFGRALRKAPGVFYVLALVADALFIIGMQLALPPWVREYVLFIFQSNTLAMGMFIIVMFVGVLGEGSPLRKPLLQIRAELSIVASLLCIGHVVMYGRSYLEQLLSSMLEMPLARLLATLVAVLLVLLLIPLALTSFKAIRARMRPQSWRRLQRFAYLFFALIFVHILFYLLPPALAGSTGAAISLAVYLALGAIYAILRVRQALRPAPAVASSQLMS